MHDLIRKSNTVQENKIFPDNSYTNCLEDDKSKQTE